MTATSESTYPIRIELDHGWRWRGGCPCRARHRRWSQSIQHLLVGVGRWTFRVDGYVYLLTGEYRPVSLD